jgi:hypothetical protein
MVFIIVLRDWAVKRLLWAGDRQKVSKKIAKINPDVLNLDQGVSLPKARFG